MTSFADASPGRRRRPAPPPLEIPDASGDETGADDRKPSKHSKPNEDSDIERSAAPVTAGGEPEEHPSDATAALPAVPGERAAKRHAATRRTGRRNLIAALLGVVVLGVAVAEVGDVVAPSDEPVAAGRESEDSAAPSEEESTGPSTEEETPPSPTETTPEPSATTEEAPESPTAEATTEEPPPPVEASGSVETTEAPTTPPTTSPEDTPPPSPTETTDPTASPDPTPTEEEDCFLWWCD